MKLYKIEYSYNGKKATAVVATVVTTTENWKEQFFEKVLNRIESITNAGAVITQVIAVN